MRQLCNMATSILLHAERQKLMITNKIKWFSNNHNKGRFTWHYFSVMERPYQEGLPIIMQLQAAFCPCVSCRACDKMSCEQGSLHWVLWAARYRTTPHSGVRALALSCTNLVIMRRALVIQAEIFKLPKGFRCSVPIKFNGVCALKSHPQ